MAKPQRSVSMAQIPKRSISTVSLDRSKPAPPTQPSMIAKINSTAYSHIYFLAFRCKPGLLIGASLRAIEPLMWPLGLLGQTAFVARAWRAAPLYALLLYQLLLAAAQVVLLVLLVLGYERAGLARFRWLPVAHQAPLAAAALALWAGLRLRTLRAGLLAEPLCSYVVQSAFVARKRRTTRLCCALHVAGMAAAAAAACLWMALSTDVYGVKSVGADGATTLFNCGVGCDVFRYIVTVLNFVAIMGAAAVFAVLARNITAEAEKLSEDIQTFPGTDGIDHYVYRFQSVEKSARALNTHFSSTILLFGLFSGVGVVLALKDVAREMIAKNEMGAVILWTHLGVLLLAFLVFTVSGLALNRSFENFRQNGHKVLDLQQICNANSASMIKLLSLMLRLNAAEPPIRLGALFPITYANALMATISLLFCGFLVYSIDHGCLKVF